jgi:hypothetical protein
VKRLWSLVLIFVLLISLSACAGYTAVTSSSSTSSLKTTVASKTTIATDTAKIVQAVEASNTDITDNTDALANAAQGSILLQGDTIAFQGDGATVKGSTVTITTTGIYTISGTLNDGQIVVDAGDNDKVILVLNDAIITSDTSAPIYVLNADKVIITLAANTKNTVTDARADVSGASVTEDPNAAIFSHDDLTINGSGSLVVNASYHNGIASKDDLKINGGNITVNSANDGLKGHDSIIINAGFITINAKGDGLQSTNDVDTELGYIAIEGGTLNIISGQDGIQAQTILIVNGGDINITSGGGSQIKYNSGTSAKGLKAGVDITITAGTIVIDSTDDAINSNDSITINGGDLTLSSGDDGIHADTILVLNAGNINIKKSYEGIESKVIRIEDGSLKIVASDDGINTSDGSGGTGMNARPGDERTIVGDSYSFTINGGYVSVDAKGDGIDVNGMIEMTGGVVIVNGPTSNGDGPLDYLGAFNITGGYLLAVGSSGMALAPSATSTQYSIMYNFTTVQAAGTLVHIETADGKEIVSFIPTKSYQSIVLSSADLAKGETYVIYAGGSATGTSVDGLYSESTYSAGSQVASMTISSMVTSAGAVGRVGPGGTRPGRS